MKPIDLMPNSFFLSSTQGLMSDKVAGIFDSVFECTLNMITKNFEDYPEHRSGLYKMLQTINANCFPGKDKNCQIMSQLVSSSCANHVLFTPKLFCNCHRNNSNSSWTVSSGPSNIPCGISLNLACRFVWNC
jgi:hypothetical protein